VVGGATTELFGWRWIFVLYAMPLVVAGLVGLNLVDGPPATVGRVRDQARETLAEVSRPATATVVVLGGLVFLIMFGLFLTVLPIHLDHRFGLGPMKRGLVAAVPALTSTVSALMVARARARVHAGWLVYAGLGVFACTFVVMGVGPLWALVVATAVYGLAEGLTIPTMQDLVASDAPDHLRGSVIAVWTGSVRIGQTIGPVGVTLALGVFSTGSVLVLAGVGLLGVSVVTTAARTLVPRTDG
jgi:MFS family permease